jgi:hypothetical protein
LQQELNFLDRQSFLIFAPNRPAEKTSQTRSNDPRTSPPSATPVYLPAVLRCRCSLAAPPSNGRS